MFPYSLPSRHAPGCSVYLHLPSLPLPLPLARPTPAIYSNSLSRCSIRLDVHHNDGGMTNSRSFPLETIRAQSSVRSEGRRRVNGRSPRCSRVPSPLVARVVSAGEDLAAFGGAAIFGQRALCSTTGRRGSDGSATAHKIRGIGSWTTTLM